MGLGALAVALVLGFIYLDPASGESRRPVEISLGQTPTPIPTVGPTQVPPTPRPTPVALTQPAGGWLIGIYQDAFSGGELLVSQAAATKLDVTYPLAPFLDVRDDAWSLRAETDFDVVPGRYLLTLEYEGRLTVFANGRELFSEESTGGSKTREVEFEVTGRDFHLRIDLRDVKGPLRLRLVE